MQFNQNHVIYFLFLSLFKTSFLIEINAYINYLTTKKNKLVLRYNAN